MQSSVISQKEILRARDARAEQGSPQAVWRCQGPCLLPAAQLPSQADEINCQSPFWASGSLFSCSIHLSVPLDGLSYQQLISAEMPSALQGLTLAGLRRYLHVTVDLERGAASRWRLLPRDDFPTLCLVIPSLPPNSWSPLKGGNVKTSHWLGQLQHFINSHEQALRAGWPVALSWPYYLLLLSFFPQCQSAQFPLPALPPWVWNPSFNKCSNKMFHIAPWTLI